MGYQKEEQKVGIYNLFWIRNIMSSLALFDFVLVLTGALLT